MHILVVKDNADCREILQLTLELSGHRVEAAADESRAIKMALDSRLDVALIDIGLPDLDGHELARL
jgi:DNA-binding response OmpR family regulator